MTRLVVSTIACMVVTYLVCGIPFGLVIAKSKGVDVRKTGSGNIGTTNVARSVGAGASGLTLLLDAGKGFACVALSRLAIPSLAGVDKFALAPSQRAGVVLALVYLMCVVGHVFSIYLGFKGGKGIAVGFGGALALKWQVAMGLLLVFVVLVVATRFVSLGSTCAAISLPVWGAVTGFDKVSVVVLVAIGALVVWAHRSNIKKLASGTESKFSFHKSDKA